MYNCYCIILFLSGQQIRALSYILSQQMKQPNSKVMVFFPTARQTQYMAELFRNINIEVLEIHSRKTQGSRTATSEKFRQAKKGIMFSSDVTARGMDYPDVTLVLQMGLTDKNQYVHRLGRTARAGKEGSGLLICSPFELAYMQTELSEMPLEVISPPDLSAKTRPGELTIEGLLQAQETEENMDSAKMAWGAWLGFYNRCLHQLYSMFVINSSFI